jgi:Icc-related predicted phosphoesterase
MNTICLYAAADLHGRQTGIDIVTRQASRSEVQAVVLAGDVVHYHRGHAVMERLAALPKPVYAVRGNTDPRRVERRMAASPRFHPLDFKRRQLDGLPMVGVSGTLAIPFCSRIGWFEARHLDRLAAQIDSRTILVVHPPPWGIRDRVAGRWHAGSRGLRRLVQKASPAVLICGHIHEAAGIEMLGRTLVVNCALGKRGQGAIITYDGQGDPTARML